MTHSMCYKGAGLWQRRLVVGTAFAIRLLGGVH